MPGTDSRSPRNAQRHSLTTHSLTTLLSSLNQRRTPMCPRYTIRYCRDTHQHQPPGGSSSAAQDCPEDKGWVLLGARFPPGKGFLYGLLDMGTETSKAPQPCPALQLPPSAPRHSALLPVAPSLHHTRPISSPQQDRAQGLRGPPVLEVPLHRNASQQERALFPSH